MNLEKRIVEHLDSFEVRQKALSQKFDELSEMKQLLVSHINDENDQLKRMHNVIFGNDKEKSVGMRQQLDEVHTKFVQANGIVGMLKLLLIIGGASTILYSFFRKF